MSLFGSRSTEAEVNLSTDRLASLVADRDVMAEALSALAQEPLTRGERWRLERLIGRIDSLSADASGRASVAPAITGNVTAQGDDSPRPSQSLLTISRSLAESPRGRMPAGLVYPSVVIGLTLLVAIGLGIGVVPMFETMFDEFGLTLPVPTAAVVGLSRWLRLALRFWIVMVGVFLVLGGILYFGVRPLQRCCNRWGFWRRGGTPKLLAMSRFARDLADRTETGERVEDAIRRAGSACGDEFIASSATRLATGWGAVPSTAIRPVDDRFPANLIEALDGDRADTGRPNVALLRTLADLYAERAAVRSETGTTLLGMIALMVVGLFVGGTVLSLFMPLINLMTGLS